MKLTKKKKRRLIITISVSLVLVFCVIIGMAYSSMYWEIIYRINNPIVPQENTDIPALDPMDSYNELHRMILELDYDKIPNDAELGTTIADYVIGGGTANRWDMKTYLTAYKLFAEICNRPEINPADATVKITPADLFGMWLNEQGALNYNKFDTYLQWDFGVYRGLYYGPFCQDMRWTDPNAGLGSNDNAIAIYISKEENPTLDDSKRAIRGLPNDIKSDKGIYCTPESLTALYTQGRTEFEKHTANTAEIQDSIKQGTLALGKKSRPHSGFFPDAAYTQALRVRIMLQGLNQHTLSKTKNPSAYNIVELVKNYSDNEEIGELAKAVTMNTFSGDWKYLQVSSAGEPLGLSVKTYLKILDNPDLSMLQVKNLAPSDRKQMMVKGPAFLDNFLLTGQTSGAIGKDSVSKSTTDSILGKLGIQNEIASDMSNYNWELQNTYFYGFRIINNGYEINRIAEEIIKRAHSHQEWLLDDLESGDIEDGEKPTAPCGEDGCLCGLTGDNNTSSAGYYTTKHRELAAKLTTGSLTEIRNPTNGYKVTTGWQGYLGHKAVDYAIPVGTPIYAVADGYVVYAQSVTINNYKNFNSKKSLGSRIYMVHNDFYSGYCHLSRFAHIKVGDFIAKGTLIGYSGNTGNSSGPHLHFQLSRDFAFMRGQPYAVQNIFINPQQYIKD